MTKHPQHLSRRLQKKAYKRILADPETERKGGPHLVTWLRFCLWHLSIRSRRGFFRKGDGLHSFEDFRKLKGITDE